MICPGQHHHRLRRASRPDRRSEPRNPARTQGIDPKRNHRLPRSRWSSGPCRKGQITPGNGLFIVGCQSTVSLTIINMTPIDLVEYFSTPCAPLFLFGTVRSPFKKIRQNTKKPPRRAANHSKLGDSDKCAAEVGPVHCSTRQDRLAPSIPQST